MKKEIEKLIKKHKKFVEDIEKKLIKETDDFGNARRLEDYIKGLKEKTFADKEEKEMILKEMMSDYDASDAYQRFLDEFDAPRWYLEKTYPTFYKYFKERYKTFLDNWTTKISTEFKEDFKDALFVDYCKKIMFEIDDEINFKETIIEIEKKGVPNKVHGKMNLSRDFFFQIIDDLFEIPELIIATLTAEKEKVETKLENWENKYAKYPIALYKKAFKLQEEAAKNMMKLTDENAIIKANDVLEKINKKDLINENGMQTEMLLKITKTYSNYWKPMLKSE